MERVTIAGPGALGVFLAVKFSMAGIEAGLLDYDGKRAETEISSFNGAIIEEGRRRGKETPVNTIIFNIVTFLEEKQE